MISLWSLLSIAHLLGLALAVGAATVKFTLLLKCSSNIAFAQHYMEVARPVTRLIILGLVLLTLSGISWIALGFSLTPLLSVKVFFVAVVWVLGPIIDNVVEPKFRRLLPAPGEAPTPAFSRVQKQYVALEGIATGLLYVITIMGTLVLR